MRYTETKWRLDPPPLPPAVERDAFPARALERALLGAFAYRIPIDAYTPVLDPNLGLHDSSTHDPPMHDSPTTHAGVL